MSSLCLTPPCCCRLLGPLLQELTSGERLRDDHEEWISYLYFNFRKRLPCGEVEKARKAIRTFFLLRSLSLSLQGVKETCLPLSNPDSFVQAGDVLDLNNSDLLAVTVVLKEGTRQRRFDDAF